MRKIKSTPIYLHSEWNLFSEILACTFRKRKYYLMTSSIHLTPSNHDWVLFHCRFIFLIYSFSFAPPTANTLGSFHQKQLVLSLKLSLAYPQSFLLPQLYTTTWYVVRIRKYRKKFIKIHFIDYGYIYALSKSQGRPAEDASLRVTYRTIWGHPEDISTVLRGILGM